MYNSLRNQLVCHARGQAEYDRVWREGKWVRYSVMQSDGNSFGGDVVLDNFNKASRDEDIIF